MRMTISLTMSGLLLLAAAPGAAAAEPGAADAVVGWTAAESALPTALAMVQGQGRGQGKAEERGRGSAEARGNGQARGAGQAREQGRAGGQPEARGQSQGQGRAQGQGEGRAQGQGGPPAGRGAPSAGQRPEQARGASPERGRSAADAARAGRPGRASAADRGPHRLSREDLRRHIAELPAPLRQLAGSDRRHERMVAGALARGKARGMDPARLDVRARNGGISILGAGGATLLQLDEARARDLGAWEVRRLGDRRPNAGSPAFCRSGEGHPVWGREWCIEKGFGLGSRDGTIWSRGTVEDIVFGRRDTRDRLDRGGLIDVLGDVVFGRLALHAVTMGYADPLSGIWVQEPDGPRILRVRSGDLEVAELYDRDRDDRVEVIYVVQPRW